MSARDPMATAREIDSILEGLAGSEVASAEARRLVTLVMSLHTSGLTRLVELVRGAGGGALLRQIAGDPLVASLLSLHDLDPLQTETPLLQIGGLSDKKAHHGEAQREHRCELCAATVPETHAHLIDLETRRLLCACAICRSVGGKYRMVPSRYVTEPSMRFTPAEWETLGIPVGLVFFVVNSRLARTFACYPGPAGATESVLPLETWPALAARYAWVADLAPDVEALLVRRTDDGYRCFIVPLDACYELVGRIRRTWTGLGGGAVAEREIDGFIADVIRRDVRSAEVPA
jgi:hypothetical protein